METIKHVIEWFAFGIELLAVAVIIGGVMILGITRGTVRYLFRLGEEKALKNYKIQLIRPLLLGLDLMVAADVIRTVILDLTIDNVAILGLLVLIRTLLSWTLSVELEGHWPWQASSNEATEKEKKQGL